MKTMILLGVSDIFIGFWMLALNGFKLVEEKLSCVNSQSIENGICYGKIEVVEKVYLTPLFLIVVGSILLVVVIIGGIKNGKHRTIKQKVK